MCWVWLFARPLIAPNAVLALQSQSEERLPLAHWGVLVTSVNTLEVKHACEIVRSDNNDSDSSDNMDLGTMYELHRAKGNMIRVMVTREVFVRDLRSNWATFSAQFIGRTTRSPENIELAGIIPNG